MSFIDKVCDIVDVFECIFFVEVMGCNVGFLVLNGVFFVVVDYVVVFEFFEFVEIEIKKIVNQIKVQCVLKGFVSFIVVVVENVWFNGLIGLIEVLQYYNINDVRLVILGYV